MKILPFILLLCSSCQAQQKKWPYTCAGAVISTASYHLLVQSNKNKWKSRAGAVLITFVAAIGKEYYDHISSSGRYNSGDVWSTMAGCVSLTFTFPINRK